MKRRPSRWSGWIAAWGVGFVIAPAVTVRGDDPPANRPAIYDEKADAKMLIVQALAVAKRENQRVLLMFGANWCGWCHKLHELFQSDGTISRLLLNEYQQVMVDIGRLDRHMDLASGYGADLKKNGVPFLVVLDADGKAVTAQETGSLEEGDLHNHERVKAFLERWKAPPLDARKVVDDALSRARSEKKMVFLHSGALWCPYCRDLDAYLARQDVADILGEDFVEAKIDVDRMTGAAEVIGRFWPSKDGGIPWFVFTDGEGKVLVDSRGPAGNVGFPVTPEEINHFVSMLKKTARNINAQGIATLESILRETSRRIQGRS